MATCSLTRRRIAVIPVVGRNPSQIFHDQRSGGDGVDPYACMTSCRKVGSRLSVLGQPTTHHTNGRTSPCVNSAKSQKFARIYPRRASESVNWPRLSVDKCRLLKRPFASISNPSGGGSPRLCDHVDRTAAIARMCVLILQGEVAKEGGQYSAVGPASNRRSRRCDASSCPDAPPMC